MKVVLTIPGVLISTQNTGAWAQRRATKAWRMAVYLATYNARPSLPLMWHDTCSLRITMTRIFAPPARAYGYATLVYALKAAQDGLCDALWRGECPIHKMRPCGHAHDEDPRLTWAFEQERGDKPAVRVEVTHGD